MSPARRSPAAARRLLRAAQALLPAARGPGLTVLAYHLVGAGTDSAVDLPADLFRRQLDELTEHAEVVPLRDGLAALAGGAGKGLGGASGRPRVAITFDDAYRNFVTAAWPELAERALPATLFAPVGFVAGDGPPPNRDAPLPAARREDLRDLAGGGVEIGSHTWSHRDLTRLADGEVDAELRRSRETLEDWLGTPVDAFCYPRGLWDARVERRVGEVYRVATVGGGRRFRPGDDPLRVERVSLRRDGPFSLLPALRAGVWLEERLADRWRRWRG